MSKEKTKSNIENEVVLDNIPGQDYQQIENSMETQKEVELLKKTLQEQNVNLVNKSIELLHTKNELEQKNKELQNLSVNHKSENIKLINKSIELSDIKNELEDKNYDLKESQTKLSLLFDSLKNSEERFRDLANLLPQPIFETDIDNYITYTNSFGYESFGYTENDVEKGITLMQLVAPEDRTRASKSLYNKINNKPIEIEFKLIRKDGSIFPALVYTSVIYSNGNPTGLRGILFDISKRKKLEEELKTQNKINELRAEIWKIAADKTLSESELIQKLLENIGLALGVNRAGFLKYFPKQKEFVALNIWNDGKFPTSLGAKIPHHITKYFVNREFVEIPKDLVPGIKQIATIKLKKYQIESYLVVPFGSDKIERKMLLTLTDCEKKRVWSRSEKEILKECVKIITNRIENIRAEKALFESEAKYSSLVENSNDGIALIQDQKILYVNHALCKLVGFTRKQAINSTLWKWIDKKDHNHLKKRTSERKRGLKIINKSIINLKRTDKNLVPVEINPNLIKYNNRPADIIFIRDISDRLKAEEELRNSEERLKILFEFAPDGYYISDLKGAIIDGNRAAEKIIGKKRKEVIGENFLENKLISRDQLKKAAKLLAKNALGFNTGPDEFEINRNDGQKIPVEISTVPIKIKGKRVVLGMMHNVSLRKEMECRLRESEEKFRSMAELLPEMIYESDLEGNLTYVNKKALESLEYSEKESISNVNILDTILKSDRKKILNSLQGILIGKRNLGHEYTAITKSGRKFPAFINSSVIVQNYKPVGYRGIILDLTERKKAEKIKEENLARKKIVTSYFEGQEIEKKRISKKLHESIGQSLLALNLSLESVKNTDVYTTRSTLIEVKEEISTIVNQIRHLSANLSPLVLYELGLEKALASFLRSVQHTHGINISFNSDISELKVDDKINNYIYRIVQEAVTNIIKHAKADSIIISINGKNDELGVHIEDNGIGFNVDEKIDDGIGIYNMKERINLLNGKVLFNSKENIGTKISFVIPLKY